ncbi:hypothetical protein HELRODRAFT_71625, partial [Helobdella robusta]|uniref:BolA family transcriptional regulator n=1 Tax=Helobdella robusta TaxID=6412 RepID=T1G0P2_HELRO
INFYQPSHLDIINESYKHNVPKDSETHFKVVIISDLFKDIGLTKRHQMVYDVLKEELKSGVHALSIVAKTEQQWQESSKTVEPSPQCLGGMKHQK